MSKEISRKVTWEDMGLWTWGNGREMGRKVTWEDMGLWTCRLSLPVVCVRFGRRRNSVPLFVFARAKDLCIMSPGAGFATAACAGSGRRRKPVGPIDCLCRKKPVGPVVCACAKDWLVADIYRVTGRKASEGTDTMRRI
jgi:hypothetical protein